MMIRKYSVLIFAALLLLGAGCKPTEKNYRAAYDAAKAKREKANEEAMVPTTGLLSDDGPMLKIVKGDSLFVSRDRLRVAPEDAEALRSLPYSIGVGMYKMHTNAEASAADLSKKGYQAQAVRTTGDRWYVIAGRFSNLDEAQNFITEFKKKNPGYPYIGLPGAPVVIGR